MFSKRKYNYKRICRVKRKSEEENRLKSLFNIANRLNASTKISKRKDKMKNLNEELQKEEDLLN
jgi:hypothetical protein